MVTGLEGLDPATVKAAVNGAKTMAKTPVGKAAATCVIGGFACLSIEHFIAKSGCCSIAGQGLENKLNGTSGNFKHRPTESLLEKMIKK